MNMVSLLVLVRVATISFLLLSSISLVTRMELLLSFYNGTLKLRYSSTPFSKKFPSCGLVLVLDPVFIFRIMILCSSVQRNSFRITGKKFRSQARTVFWGWSSNA